MPVDAILRRERRQIAGGDRIEQAIASAAADDFDADLTCAVPGQRALAPTKRHALSHDVRRPAAHHEPR